MKTMMRGLTLAAVLLTGAVTQAELILDDFSVSSAADLDSDNNPGTATTSTVALGTGIDRTLTAFGSEVSGAATSIGVNGGTGTVSGAISSGAGVAISYNLTGFAGNRGFFVDRVLKTGLSSNIVLGTQSLRLTLTAVSAGSTNASAVWLVSSLPSAIDMLSAVSGPGGNGHLAAFANVDTLTLRIDNLSTGAVPIVTFNSSTGISAIPEPATMSLLGLTAIGGIFAHRRRKNQLAA